MEAAREHVVWLGLMFVTKPPFVVVNGEAVAPGSMTLVLSVLAAWVAWALPASTRRA